MATAQKTALVIGATGVIGRTLLRHLDGLDDWNTVAVSRRAPDFETAARHVAADLSDPADARAKLGRLNDVTHVFYAAYVDRPGWAAQRSPNAALLVNAVEALEPAAPHLAHICLMQGTKYYGCHLGPFRTPAKEDDPRHDGPNFYFDQQDFLVQRQAGAAWSWSCLRPHVVCGYARGNPLNLVSVIAVYAAIAKELGRPLGFPGKPGAYAAVYQATDAGLLARAAVWAATEPGAADQAFNITNGDFIRWQNTWPKIADYFGLEPGPVETLDLTAFMADKEPVWQAIVEKHGLAPTPFAEAANWAFGNYAFGSDWDIMSDTGKCRKHGFLEFIDTEEMFFRCFDELRALRIIP